MAPIITRPRLRALIRIALAGSHGTTRQTLDALIAEGLIANPHNTSATLTPAGWQALARVCADAAPDVDGRTAARLADGDPDSVYLILATRDVPVNARTCRLAAGSL